MRRLSFLLLAALLLGAVQLATPAPSRAEDWCWGDPILRIDNDSVNITIDVQGTPKDVSKAGRVAYEVHDGLAQVAASAHQHLQAFASLHRPRRPAAKEQLERAVELMQRTVREARRVAAGLRPTVLDDFGLAAALRIERDGLRGDGWDIVFEDALGPERLPPAIETALFRSAQEAAVNARKHSGSTRRRVRLQRTAQAVFLEAQDWGRACPHRTRRRPPDQGSA